MTDAARLHSPAAERNRGPILTELRRLLPPHGLAVEIASGTGQHAAHFAAGLPGWSWQPTDADARALESIAAWCAGLPNVRPAQRVDVLSEPWPGVPAQVDAVFCANMLHISPWPTCTALLQGSAARLVPRGLLLLYGPYFVGGEPAAPGNLAFDADLRRRDPAWGVRRLDDVQALAAAAGLRLRERIAMPANNLLLVFERGADQAGTAASASSAVASASASGPNA
jgi:hypothetical protein